MTSTPETIDALYAGLCLADEMVAKALKVKELARIARAETRLREYLAASWRTRASKAVDRAVAAATSGKSATKVERAVANAMAPWEDTAISALNRATASIYKLGRQVGWRKGSGATKDSLQYESEVKKASDPFPGFDVYDENAVEALDNFNMFWVSGHYSRTVSATIAEVVRDALVKSGGDLKEAGRLIREALERELGKIKLPGGFIGSADAYFEGLAANAATVARVYGQLRSFEQAGVRELEIVNPMDLHTSEFCEHMNGKVFTVEQARAQIDAELAATTPEAFKKAHPWVSVDELHDISPKPGNVGDADAAALAAAGIGLPPYHWRCRTTIDVR